MTVDIPGVLFPIWPHGGVPALPEILFNLLNIPGTWSAAGGLDRGELRLRTGGLFFIPGHCRLNTRDPPVDVYSRFLPHLVGDVGVGVQGGGRRHMADDRRERLHIHSILQGHGGKRVT